MNQYQKECRGARIGRDCESGLVSIPIRLTAHIGSAENSGVSVRCSDCGTTNYFRDVDIRPDTQEAV